MSASDHLQPHQLSLFIQAKDLFHTPSDEAGHDNEGNRRSLAQHVGLYDHKVEESQLPWDDYDSAHGLAPDYYPEYDDPEPSLYDSIRSQGVHTPVNLRLNADNGKYQEILTNGNHRVSVANAVNPEMWIPVRYTEHFFDQDHSM